MIVPDIDHGDLRIGHSEQSLRKPHGVPLKIKCLEFIAHLLAEWGSVLVSRVLKLEPFLEQVSLPHDCIVINLISASNHNMKRLDLVRVHDIAPKRIRAREHVRTAIELAGEIPDNLQHTLHSKKSRCSCETLNSSTALSRVPKTLPKLLC